MSFETKSALITGISGQDGSYLAELLLEKGYEVHGLIRRASNPNTDNIDAIRNRPGLPDGRLHLHYGDLTDSSILTNLLRDIQPDEIYNLGAQSHVKVSFETPVYTADVTGVGAMRLLEAARASKSQARIYQASPSDLYGTTPPPQNETSPMHPRSPYAVSKLFAYWATVNYREAYDMFAVNGILFSHESPRRGVNFVTRKITRAVARIKLGLQDTLYLGNTAARRDWGYAPEYVEGMWRMLQADAPEDYVLATGVSASVQDFVNMAFESVDLDPDKHVQIAERYFRPSEVNDHLGDPTKAKQQLGWEAATKWDDLARLMVEADIDILADELNGAKARRR